MDRDNPAFSRDILHLWAKGNPQQPGDAYHPLLCHLIDVGAVAAALWEACIPASARAWFAAQIGLDAGQAARWVALWSAMHDVGKASPAFQERRRFPTPIPHGTVSAVILRDLLTAAPFQIEQDVADRLATVIGGHHGVFPGAQEINRAATDRNQVGRDPWPPRQAWLGRECARLLEWDEPSPPPRLTNAGALWLAGFISVADWIGSNSDFFPFAAPAGRVITEVQDGSYPSLARERAARALTALGWSAWPRSTNSRAFADLFPFAPNDLQRRVVEIADRFARQALVIVEAPMGEGKSEAALYLADRGNAALGMRGHYLALPTQSTSNQMFARERDYLARRYPGQIVNTQLLHGHAALSEDLRALKTDERSFLTALEIPLDHNLGFDGAPPGVVAAGWFTARKRGLLAPFGVGTIDQALLAVLQTKHFFVRLLGLAGKTVVFDEVHAYDAYMSVLLERLLGWLAALGCSVVLLSATLPHARRAALLRAYAGDGHAGDDAPPAASVPYPRLTWRSGDATGEAPVGTSSRSRKRVRLRWLASDEDGSVSLGRDLAGAMRDGGCAAIICNTVRRAQEVYRELRAVFPPDELSLFHARYLYEERARRERETLRRFGKPGAGVARSRRAVLVATQVIEQSLDLDFDLMATELAPADLVLQRSGRLHRHERKDRPAGLSEPVLWVLGPAERDGLPRFSAGTTYVYDEHILLRSWLALRHRSEIAVPEDVSALIEAVYDETRPCPAVSPIGLPERWQATLEALQGKRRRERGIAQDNLILPPDYPETGFLEKWNRQLEEDDPSIHRELQALTRLGEQTVTAICLTPREVELLRPRAKDAPDRAAELLRRSVGLADRRIVYDLAEMAPPAAWKTTALLRNCRLVELDPEQSAEIGNYRLRIDDELGVFVTDAKKE